MSPSRPSELVQQGESVYQHRLQPLLEAEHLNRFVAIEPTSGDYCVRDTLSEAVNAVRKLHPDRLAYVKCIGQTAAVYLGARL
jgi:hypothetical protein